MANALFPTGLLGIPSILTGENVKAGIDLPPQDAIVSRGLVRVEGWVVFGERPAVAVVASIDGNVKGSTLATSMARPDVLAALGLVQPIGSGWTMDVDLFDVASGPVELQIAAWGGPGFTSVDVGTLTVVVSDDAGGTKRSPERDYKLNEAVGTIEDPSSHTRKPGLPPGWLTVSGWVLGARGPVDAVEIFVGEDSVGLARIGLARPDVFDVYPIPWAKSSGFEQRVNLSTFSGSTSISVIARTADEDIIVLDGGEITVLDASSELSVRKSPVRSPHEANKGDLPSLLTLLPSARTDDLNLVVMTHNLVLGGAQLWLTELLDKSGAGREFPCTVISPTDGPLTGQLANNGIEVHITRPFSVGNVKHYESQITELGLWMRARGYNSVLANTFDSFVGADLGRRLGIPVTWAIHESWTPQEYWSALYPPGYVDSEVQDLVEETLAETSAVIFEAEATKRLYGSVVLARSAVVIPYGVDTALIDSYCAVVTKSMARRDLDLPLEGRVILILGTTEPRKAQLLVAEVFATMAQRYPDTTLVIVGDTGTPYAETLKDLVRATGLSEMRIRIIPVVADTFPWYRVADILLCASDIESLPRSVLEGMCFGATIVSTSVYGLPELLTDGETGLLFEPRSRSALAAALTRALDLDVTTLEKIGAAGKAHVRNNYNSHGYTADVLAIMRGLLREPDRSPGEFVVRRGQTL